MSRTLALRAALAALAATGLACGSGDPGTGVARQALVDSMAFDPPLQAILGPTDCAVGTLALKGSWYGDVPVTFEGTNVTVYGDPFCGSPLYAGNLVVPAGAASAPFSFRALGAGPGSLRAFMAATPSVETGWSYFTAGTVTVAFATQPPPSIVAGMPVSVDVETTSYASGQLELSVCEKMGFCRLDQSQYIYGAGRFTFAPILTQAGKFTLQARAPNGELAFSNEFEVVAASPVFSLPYLGAARAGLPLELFQVTVRDTYYNPVVATTVTASILYSPEVQFAGTTSVLTDAAGLADFTGLIVTTAGSFQYDVAAGPVHQQSSLSVAPGPPVLGIAEAPAGELVAGTAFAVVVETADAYGNLHPESVWFTVDDGMGNPYASTSVSPYGGQARASFEVTKAGIYSVRAETQDGFGSYRARTGPFTVVPGPATSAPWGVYPTTATAGVPFSAAASVFDVYGNPVETGVSLSILEAGTATLIGGGTKLTDAATGEVVWGSLELRKAGLYHLVISVERPGDTPLEYNGVAFTVVPGTPIVSVTSGPGASIVAGTSFPVGVKIEDAYQNPISRGVTLSLQAGNGASLVGAVTGTTVGTDGTLTLPNLAVQKAGAGYRVVATSGLYSGMGTAFDVTPAAPVLSKFTFSSQPPTSVAAGAAFGATVKVTDSFDNPVPATVSLALDQTNGGALLGTASAATDAAGSATFSGLQVQKAGSYTLTATIPSPALARTSAGFTVVPATAVVSVTAGPAASIGADSTFAVDVKIEDAYANPIATPVALSLSAGNGAALSGTVSGGTTAAGVASFPGLSVRKAGSGYQVVASGGGQTGSGSVFEVVPALPVASGLTFTAPPPATLAAGQSFQVAARLLDPYGNAVATDVTLALDPGDATSLAGTTVRATSASTGVATFPGLSVTRAGSYALRAIVSSPAALEVASGTVAVSPAGASAVSFVQHPPATPSADDVFDVAVRVTDAYQNPIATTVALALFDPASVATPFDPAAVATLIGPAVADTSAGLASFPGLAVHRAGGPYHLVASVASPALSTDGVGFSVVAGAPAALVFQDFQATTGTTAFALEPIHVEVDDAWGNVARASTAPVTLGVASGPTGAVVGGTAVRAPSLGVATFDDVLLATAGVYRLKATEGAITGEAPASTVVYEPGSTSPAHHLAWATPPRTTAAGACSEPMQVEARDAADQRLSMLTPVALALAGTGVTFYADASCDASPITTTQISQAGVAEFRARSAVAGSHTVAVQANLNGVNGATGVGVKTAAQNLVIASGTGDTTPDTAPAAKEDAGKPLNGWSTGCGAAGGAPSSAALLGVVAIALLRGRRRRGGIALLVLAIAVPALAATQPRKAANGFARTSTSAATPAPTSTSLPTAAPAASPIPVPIPPPPPAATPARTPTSTQAPPPARRRDPRPAAAVLTAESNVPGERLDVAALTDVFASAFDEPRWFRVVAPRDVVAALALERQKEMMGCSADQSCLAELAGALGVEYVAALSIGRVGESLVVSARLIDPRRGVGVARSSITAFPDQLVPAVADAARVLLETYRAARPQEEQARLVLPERRSPTGSGRFALRLGGIAGYAPGAEEGARGSAGAELGLAWRASPGWSFAVAGVAGPNPGVRIGVYRRLTGGAVRLSAGLRGAGWPGAGAYGGGAALEAAVGLTRDLDLVGSVAGEGYAAQKQYGSFAVLGGLGFTLRL